MTPFEEPTPQFLAGDRVRNTEAFEYNNGNGVPKRVPAGRTGTVTKAEGPHLAVVVDDTGRTWMQDVWHLQMIEEADTDAPTD